MPVVKRRQDFATSEEGIWVAEILNAMVLDSAYMTKSSFSADSEHYPDNLMPFTDKHMQYLLKHPDTDAKHYISNLKMISKIR